MVLENWLTKSGHRTENQVREMADDAFARDRQAHYGNYSSAVIYTMLQELATQRHYCILRQVVAGRDPVLDRVLELVAIDEAAHAQFFRTLVGIYLEDDRERTLEHFRHVVRTFRMPADDLLGDSRRRIGAVRALKIFDEEIFFTEVYQPLLQRLGLTRADLRTKKAFPVS